RVQGSAFWRPFFIAVNVSSLWKTRNCSKAIRGVLQHGWFVAFPPIPIEVDPAQRDRLRVRLEKPPRHCTFEAGNRECGFGSHEGPSAWGLEGISVNWAAVPVLIIIFVATLIRDCPARPSLAIPGCEFGNGCPFTENRDGSTCAVSDRDALGVDS